MITREGWYQLNMLISNIENARLPTKSPYQQRVLSTHTLTLAKRQYLCLLGRFWYQQQVLMIVYMGCIPNRRLAPLFQIRDFTLQYRFRLVIDSRVHVHTVQLLHRSSYNHLKSQSSECECLMKHQCNYNLHNHCSVELNYSLQLIYLLHLQFQQLLVNRSKNMEFHLWLKAARQTSTL